MNLQGKVATVLVVAMLLAVVAGCAPATPHQPSTGTTAPAAPIPTVKFSANALAVPVAAQPTATAPAVKSPAAGPTPSARAVGAGWPAAPAPDYWPTDGWRTASPAAHGVDGDLLKQMDRQVIDQKIPVDSILVIKDGYLIHESYFGAAGDISKHDLASASKGFVTTLFGIARDRGLIPDLQTPLLQALGRQDFANMDDRKAAITLEDILTLRMGLKWDDTRVQDYSAMRQSQDWVKFTLDRPMVDQPGRTFNYCGGCSHLLSVLIEKYTGMRMAKFAEDALFKPLGITDYDWSTAPDGATEGATGLRLTSRDFAKLGLLYLNKGRWDGEQVVSKGWVDDATVRHTDTNFGTFGYGYKWWTAEDIDAYAALGGGAQNLWVWPAKNLIVVTTARIGDNQVWDPIHPFILPAVR